MKSLKRKQEVLRDILSQAYREKEHLAVGEQWQFGVMRRIRHLAPLKAQPDYLMFLGQFVWRLTPAACLLILVLTGVLLQLDFIPEYEMFSELMNGTETLTLAQAFGL